VRFDCKGAFPHPTAGRGSCVLLDNVSRFQHTCLTIWRRQLSSKKITLASLNVYVTYYHYYYDLAIDCYCFSFRQINLTTFICRRLPTSADNTVGLQRRIKFFRGRRLKFHGSVYTIPYRRCYTRCNGVSDGTPCTIRTSKSMKPTISGLN